MIPAAVAPLIALALLVGCDERDETFADPQALAELVAKGWVPPLPASAREIRVAWDLDINHAHFCGDGPWEDIRAAFPALEDAARPTADDAPGWWAEEVRSGTETVRVGEGGGQWVLVRTAPASFCGMLADTGA